MEADVQGVQLINGYAHLQVTFFKTGTKSLSKLTTENLKDKWLEY